MNLYLLTLAITALIGSISAESLDDELYQDLEDHWNSIRQVIPGIGDLDVLKKDPAIQEKIKEFLKEPKIQKIMQSEQFKKFIEPENLLKMVESGFLEKTLNPANVDFLLTNPELKANLDLPENAKYKIYIEHPKFKPLIAKIHEHLPVITKLQYAITEKAKILAANPILSAGNATEAALAAAAMSNDIPTTPAPKKRWFGLG